MVSNSRYKVIISDRVKRMLGTHIRFMAQVNKEAEAAKKKEIMAAMRSLKQMTQDFGKGFTGANLKNMRQFLHIGRKKFLQKNSNTDQGSSLLANESVVRSLFLF